MKRKIKSKKSKTTKTSRGIKINAKKQNFSISKGGEPIVMRGRLLSDFCGQCGQKLILRKTDEVENNQVCKEYACPDHHQTIFSLEDKPLDKPITLTPEQYKEILSDIRDIHHKLYELVRKNN